MPIFRGGKQISFTRISEVITHPQPLRRSYGTKEHRNILHYFAKTPTSIYCPHFWELRWAYGCPYNCAYCYLQGTFIGRKEASLSHPLEHILKTLEIFFSEEPNSWLFNSGELADSLMFPSIMEKIANKFEEQRKHKLLLLTKSSNVRFLIEKPRRQTIVSFSINVPEVWKLWEKRTPHPEKRIEAARKVKEVGYETRIRIDPIFPIDNWREYYENLLNMIFKKLKPDRITLGTPRGLRKTLLFSEDNSWTKYLSEDSGWGKKLSSPLRKEIYIFFNDKLNDLGFNRIGLCKETVIIWKELEKEAKNFKKEMCNCEL